MQALRCNMSPLGEGSLASLLGWACASWPFLLPSTNFKNKEVFGCVCLGVTKKRQRSPSKPDKVSLGSPATALCLHFACLVAEVQQSLDAGHKHYDFQITSCQGCWRLWIRSVGLACPKHSLQVSMPAK